MAVPLIGRPHNLHVEIPRPSAGQITVTITIPHRGGHLQIHVIASDRVIDPDVAHDQGLGTMLLYELREAIRRARADHT